MAGDRRIASSFVGLLAGLCLTGIGASTARADRCDDLAAQFASQIDGLTIGRTAANQIVLSHPQARQIMLGCASRNVANQWFAQADSRKPSPGFIDLVASGAAIIFTQPKADMVNGTTRCLKRMGLLHGDDVTIRYRRLDMHCARTKTEASILISRRIDE